jgi:hypothetical protein
MNNWVKSLAGDKYSEWWYYLWAIPGARIGNGFLRFFRWAGGIGPEKTNEWWIKGGTQSQKDRTPWRRVWCKIINVVLPAYSLHVKSWQLFVMPESQSKAKLKRILLQRVGKSNILLRLLLGDLEITDCDVKEYPHMTGYRPGAYLNTTTRYIREMTQEESEANAYEVELIKYLWTTQTKKNTA